MKDKINDIPYCGVRQDMVTWPHLSLIPDRTEMFVRFINQRYVAFQNKQHNSTVKPYCDDPIIQTNRFTNIFREDDRETRNLLSWVGENQGKISLREMMINIVMFRCWNKWESVTNLGGPWRDFSLALPVDRFIDLARKWSKVIENKEHVWYTSAFMVSGLSQALMRLESETPIGDLDKSLRPLLLGHKLFHSDWDVFVLSAKDQKESFKAINKIDGLGPFLAYQIWVDFTYLEEFPFSENHFTVAGPGCKQGLDMLFEDKAGLTYEELLFWLRDYQIDVLGPWGFHPSTLFSDRKWPDNRLNLMSLENCFCEFSKYVRLSEGLPMKRRIFPGLSKPKSSQADLFEGA